MEEKMFLNTVHHVAIIVSDYDLSRDFYVNKLGFEIIRENHRPERHDYKLDLRCGGIELEIFGLRHLAFRVTNIEEVVKELEQKGISCQPIRKDTFTGEKMTFFADPDGLPLELHE